MGKMKKFKIWAWIFSVLIFIVLINAGTVEFLNFNLLSWISFGIVWLQKVIVAIVSVFAFIGLIMLLTSIVRK